MKQQDIALIIVVAAVSGVISFFVSGFFFSGDAKEQTVARIDQIRPEFKTPSQKYFNDEAINPTRLIQIGDSTNDNPFSGNQ